MNIILHTSRKLLEETLLKAGNLLAPMERVVFSTQDEAIKFTYEGHSEWLHVTETQQGGQFPFTYEILWPYRPRQLNLRDKVEFVKNLILIDPIEVLLDDEGFNPYLFIHLGPDMTPMTVGVDPEPYNEQNEMNIEPWVESWGMVAFESSLDEALVDHVVEHLRAIIPMCSLAPVDEKVTSPDFRSARQRIPVLAKFAHFYLIDPQQPETWYSRDEKSAMITDVLSRFHDQSGDPVCLFPVNGTAVANIPGGSDSECYCIVFHGGRTEKVIYKRRRESW